MSEIAQRKHLVDLVVNDKRFSGVQWDIGINRVSGVWGVIVFGENSSKDTVIELGDYEQAIEYFKEQDDGTQ